MPQFDWCYSINNHQQKPHHHTHVRIQNSQKNLKKIPHTTRRIMSKNEETKTKELIPEPCRNLCGIQQSSKNHTPPAPHTHVKRIFKILKKKSQKDTSHHTSNNVKKRKREEEDEGIDS